MSSHKTIRIKKPAKKMRQSWPISYWIRTRIDNTEKGIEMETESKMEMGYEIRNGDKNIDGIGNGDGKQKWTQSWRWRWKQRQRKSRFATPRSLAVSRPCGRAQNNKKTWFSFLVIKSADASSNPSFTAASFGLAALTDRILATCSDSMATKIDSASAVEPHHVTKVVTTTTSSTSTTGPRVSMFGAKSGFVIPKNKLSGSLVPIARGGGKLDTSDAAKEESTKQVQRKTKWGIDLTQDAIVRKGRALAYQTRVDQITQQMKSGVLKTGDAQASESPAEVPTIETSDRRINDEARKQELLELERREAIGEILKLNPSFKVPPDYKPLLKEAVVPVPLKAYPGYNFIGLILGSGSNTQKRLEQETGSKIRIRGIKVGTQEKVEITQSDGNEDPGAYEELHVHISADTYEKVDAAVSLIELLVTPVSGSKAVVSTTPTSVSGESANMFDPSQKDASSGYNMPVPAVNQGVLQPIMGSSQPGRPQTQFQPYPTPWFPTGSPNALTLPPSGFSPHPSSLVSLPNNPVQVSPSPLNPSNVPPFFGGGPPAVAGFGSVPRNPHFAPRQQPSMPVLQQPFHDARPLGNVPPRNHSMTGPQPPSAYATMPTPPTPSVPLSFTGNQPRPTGPAPVARQPVPSMPQLASTTLSGQHPNRPFNPVGSSAGWPTVPTGPPVPQGPGNIMQTAPPQRPPPAVPQPIVQSGVPPPNVPSMVFSGPPAGNVVSPASFPPRPTPQLPGTPANHAAAAPTFASAQIQVVSGTASSVSALPAAPATMLTSLPSAGPSPASGSLPSTSRAASTPMPPPIIPQAPFSIVTQTTGANSASVPSSIQSTPIAPSQPVNIHASVPNLLQNPMLSSAQVPPPVPLASSQPQPGMPPAVSGSIPSFTPMKPPVTSAGNIPPVTAPKPQRPSSGDFTFQPIRLPSSQTVSRPSNQLVPQNTPPLLPKSSMQHPQAPQPALQPPSFRPAMFNSSPQPGMQNFPRPQINNQMGRPHAPVTSIAPGSAIPFAGSPTAIPPPPPPRIPASLNPHHVVSTPSQVGPRSFGSASHIPGPLPLRPLNPLLQQQNQPGPAPTNRPGNPSFQIHQFNSSLSFSSGKSISTPGGNQIYDPFSPTSVSSRQGDSPAKARKQENDPEYEDLMASVGVR
uniref:K Homology domain-containing protein n=1 Tax=Nelumbo nucifera TaxID=4432 RepID=A0A822YBX3_NELNU|nr:TPA_asm: hypothetical protein HUJ06_031558 [Nelumbo nucifera]